MPRKFSLQARLKSFHYALNGLRALFREEPNARIHAVAATAAIGLGLWLGLERWEWVAVGVATGLVLITEILNTAFERLCDHISPGPNELIGKVKDLAAAAVLMASLIALLIGFLVFLPKL